MSDHDAAAAQPGPNIEIVAIRDPDYSTEIHVFLDGKPAQVDEISIDPGAGYQLSDWIRSRDDQLAGASPAAAAVIRAGFDRFLDNQFITDDYADVMQELAEKYDTEILELLLAIRQLLSSVGVESERPRKMWDDNFRWTLTTLNGEDQIGDGSVDFTISLAEQRDHEGGHEFGINWSLDVTGFGGAILGGVTPFNYTPQVWVSATEDDVPVRERFNLLRSAIEEQDGDSLRDLVFKAQSSPTGYVCKQCGYPSPIGVGYKTSDEDAGENVDACQCGASRKPDTTSQEG